MESETRHQFERRAKEANTLIDTFLMVGVRAPLAQEHKAELLCLYPDFERKLALKDRDIL